MERQKEQSDALRAPQRMGIFLAVTTILLVGVNGAHQYIPDGGVVGWGYNLWGQCDAPSGLVQVDAGEVHGVGLTADGSLVAWGNNYFGQCNVPAGKFTQVAAGRYHNVGLRTDGSLVAWGYNSYGQCNVPPGNDFVRVAACNWHNVAQRMDGTLVEWPFGQNYPAIHDVVQLECGVALRADGSIAQYKGDLYPTDVELVDISVGGGPTLAVKADGSLLCWGGGQCDVPPGNDFVRVAVGGGHSVALKADGSLVAWGYNNFHQAEAPAGNNFVEVVAADGGFFNLALTGELIDPGIATVTHVSGDVFVSSLGSEVQPLDRIQQNDEVITGPNSVLSFKDFANERLASIGSNSEAQVSESGSTMAIELFNGWLRAKVRELENSSYNFELITPQSVSSVRGTEVLVSTNAEESAVALLEGEVEVSTPDLSDSVILEEGFAVDADESGLGVPFGFDLSSFEKWWPEMMLVTVASPVDLCVTDFIGRRTGTDPFGAILDEIPSSTYSGPSAVPEIIIIDSPIYGSCQLDLSASGDGDYQLDVLIDLHHQSSFDRHFGEVSTGEVLSKEIQLILPVTVDIKPGGYPNAINLNSRGSIPAAILSTSDFDAGSVDPFTVTLANAPVIVSRNGRAMAGLEDVNNDGLLDLVVHVSTEALGLTAGDQEAVLSGTTFEGIPIQGMDTVQVVP